MNSILINTALSWVTSFFENRRDVGKALTQAKIENANKHINGWGDEYLIIVWSYPFISMFVPKLQSATSAAFVQAATLPDWYIGGFVSITFAVFGINKLFRFKDK